MIENAVEAPRLVADSPPAATLEEYVAGLRAAGVGVVQGCSGSYWVSFADRVVRRVPNFDLSVPRPGEVDAALAATGGLVASYVTEADWRHRGNAWLYLCTDGSYSLGDRCPAMRRNVRRAMREFVIRPTSPAELIAHGGPAFCDTRRRNNLADGTLEVFRRVFEHHVGSAGRAYLGAWRDGQLAAFVSIVRADDWAELGSSSMDSMLRYRPNDALLWFALSKCLAIDRCRVVSYGLSSIRSDDRAAGLHRFKLKIGFQPKHVHRAFILHPAVRPFANRLTLSATYSAVEAVLRVQPRSRRLQKLAGMLCCLLGVPSARHSPA